jgi:hypothetical protein
MQGNYGNTGTEMRASAEEGEQFIWMKHKKESTPMELSDQIISQEMKIKKLEMELNDLHQGLAIVQDYYYDLLHVSEKQEVIESIEQEIVEPQHDEDRESDTILSFFLERLIADPAAHISRAEMYDDLCGVCKHPVTGLSRAFEFVFARITNPPLFSRASERLS